MAKRRPSPADTLCDTDKFENVHQVGGIRTGTLDAPGSGGGQSVRCAFFDTGAGLTFTVAIDRGGDVVDAKFNQHSLAYLTPNGLLPPSHAYNFGADWLRGWAGGLVTSCGPQYVGGSRQEDGVQTATHGHYSSLPARVEMIVNPDPHRGVFDMLLSMVAVDSKMFGPTVEVRRLIRAKLGVSEFVIEDEITNRGNAKCAHHWLYHVNLGYPLLDEGARFIYRGKAEYWEYPPPQGQSGIITPTTAAHLAAIKRVPGPLAEHAGAGERGPIVEVKPDRAGRCHVGLINPKLGIGLELEYPAKQLPRVANWQHYGPGGSYVSGVEPFSGSLLGKEKDKFPGAEQYLQPGESRRYELTVRVHQGADALREFASYDGDVVPR